MEKTYVNPIKSLKTIIIGLACVILGSLYYVYNISERPKNIIVSLRHEKSIVLKDLEKTQYLLNIIKTDNKILEEKLSYEKKKIAQLISGLKTGKLSQNSIGIYRKNVDVAGERIKILAEEIAVYRKKNDSIASVLKKEKKKNDTLKTSNKILKKTNKKLLEKITEASNLYYYNLETKCFKVKNDKKESETNNANKTNLLRINFSIAENKIIKSTDKNFYIQIIDPNNNVVGNKETLNFGENLLVFSTSINLKYENQNTIVSTELKVKNLEKGNYAINVFDNSKKVLQSKFTLN
jgi:hypothetical protein